MPRTRRERSDWSQAVADQIRHERSAAGVSMDDMTPRTGICRSTMYRIEAGTRVADVTQLHRICDALNVPVSTFMRRVEDRVPL